MFRKMLFIPVLLAVLLFSYSECLAADCFGVGVGFTTDNISLSASEFTVSVLHVFYEYQPGGIMVTTIGVYGLNIYFPVLEFDIGVVIYPAESLGLKVSVGYFSDLALSSYMGLIITGSIIINKTLELKFFGVPEGLFTQSNYAIKDGVVNGSFVKNENGRNDLKRGYAGMLICMRF